MNKRWYIYTIEHYSGIKKNQIMKFTGKWMQLEKKSSLVRYLRSRMRNMVCNWLYVVISCNVSDNQDIIHRTKEVSYRIRD